MAEAITTESKPNGAVKADIEKLASEAKAQVETTVAQAQETLDVAIAKGSDEIERLTKNTGKFVRDNPGLALAGAATIGLLIGLAARKRY